MKKISTKVALAVVCGLWLQHRQLPKWWAV